MSLPPKLPKQTAASNVVNITPANPQFERMISFIEPLAFLQFTAEQYKYTNLCDRLQKCVDEIYSMLEAQNFYN